MSFINIFINGVGSPGSGGALPNLIMWLAFFAGIRAVWKYKSKNKEKEPTSDFPKLNKGN